MKTAYQPMFELSQDCLDYRNEINRLIEMALWESNRETMDLLFDERERVEINTGCYKN